MVKDSVYGLNHQVNQADLVQIKVKNEIWQVQNTLKDAAGVIAKPLTFIINLSLETGVVPTEWKMAKVIPIFKSGSMAEIDNYRPISILPTLSKILEKMVHKQLMKHLELIQRFSL